MAPKERFVLVEFLMEAVCVTALLAMLALMGIQSSSAISALTERRSAQRVAELKQTLEQVAERQILHFLESSEFASSSDDLHLASSAGVAIKLSRSTEGWSAIAVHERLGDAQGCAIYFGDVAPPSGPVTPSAPGEVHCTEPRTRGTSTYVISLLSPTA